MKNALSAKDPTDRSWGEKGVRSTQNAAHRFADGRARPAASGVRGIGLVAPDADLARLFAGLGDVARSLHAHQRVHVHAERLLDAQVHLAGQVGILVQ